MVEINAEYLGDLECRAVHGPSGSEILTDAPADNQGLARHFSPTDLLAASVATCIMTIMGITARKHGLDISGLRVTAAKEMTGAPRRVKKIALEFVFPRRISDHDFTLLSAAVEQCPVTRSLSAEVEVQASFSFAPAAKE